MKPKQSGFHLRRQPYALGRDIDEPVDAVIHASQARDGDGGCHQREQDDKAESACQLHFDGNPHIFFPSYNGQQA
jgi:hypothetical protein